MHEHSLTCRGLQEAAVTAMAQVRGELAMSNNAHAETKAALTDALSQCSGMIEDMTSLETENAALKAQLSGLDSSTSTWQEIHLPTPTPGVATAPGLAPPASIDWTDTATFARRLQEAGLNGTPGGPSAPGGTATLGGAPAPTAAPPPPSATSEAKGVDYAYYERRRQEPPWP